MNDWEKDLKIYRLEQAPPKYENYQEYFERYFAEKDEKYISWFLHYYENELNTKARGFVNEYAMYGHFVDLKQAYVMGMMEALQRYDISRGVPFLVFKELPAMNAVHTYIRTMRTGYTVQSSYADKNLRKVMRKFAEHEYRCDEDIIAAIAEETKIAPKNVEEILMGGLLNMKITDFCRDCYTTHHYDENDLDSEGKPKRKPRRKGPFIEMAVEHGLASPDTADRTYRNALQKMHQKLSK
mgnify:CR=1 FL=1